MCCSVRVPQCVCGAMWCLNTNHVREHTWQGLTIRARTTSTKRSSRSTLTASNTGSLLAPSLRYTPMWNAACVEGNLPLVKVSDNSCHLAGARSENFGGRQSVASQASVPAACDQEGRTGVMETRTANKASVSWVPLKFRIPFGERCAALFFSTDANVLLDRGRKKTQELL